MGVVRLHPLAVDSLEIDLDARVRYPSCTIMMTGSSYGNWARAACSSSLNGEDMVLGEVRSMASREEVVMVGAGGGEQVADV